MEFNEKLQELRKNKGLTQEELAEFLFVSRAAVSKWESGRGYPSIDSLKDISRFFSVSIDDLLSGDKLIYIAEEENKSSIRSFCDMMFGIADLLSVILVFLPLYPKTVGGYVYSVNLFEFIGYECSIGTVYFAVFALLVVLGILKMISARLEANKLNQLFSALSLAVSIAAVLILGLSRQAYAVTVVFLLLTVKGIIILKCNKAK